MVISEQREKSSMQVEKFHEGRTLTLPRSSRRRISHPRCPLVNKGINPSLLRVLLPWVKNCILFHHQLNAATSAGICPQSAHEREVKLEKFYCDSLCAFPVGTPTRTIELV